LMSIRSWQVKLGMLVTRVNTISTYSLGEKNP
jgi:hypothetical protein